MPLMPGLACWMRTGNGYTSIRQMTKWVQTEHIRVALGRDYGDVPPLKGISYGGGAVSPEVAVDVERLGEEET
jgi:transglutaminase-like putative cysteine protease